MEVYAGEKSTKVYGPDVWLPEETLEVGARLRGVDQGPADHARSAAASARSTSRCARSSTSTSACARSSTSRAFPSPVKEPEKTNMVIFRENSEDIYAGIEFEAESDKAKKLIKILQDEFGVKKIRFPNTSGIGIKPVSREGTERLVRKALQYAIDNDKPSVTLVHKGNIMKFTEGRLPRLGLRAGAERVRRRADRRRPVVQVQEPEDRQGNRRQGLDRRRLPAADPAAPGRILGDRHAQPERRLRLRRAGGAGRRHRHRARAPT